MSEAKKEFKKAGIVFRQDSANLDTNYHLAYDDTKCEVESTSKTSDGKVEIKVGYSHLGRHSDAQEIQVQRTATTDNNLLVKVTLDFHYGGRKEVSHRPKYILIAAKDAKREHSFRVKRFDFRNEDAKSLFDRIQQDFGGEYDLADVFPEQQVGNLDLKKTLSEFANPGNTNPFPFVVNKP